MEPKALAPHTDRADAASRVKAWTRGRFGAIGRVLSSSAPAAYFLKSMFRLEMQKA